MSQQKMSLAMAVVVWALAAGSMKAQTPATIAVTAVGGNTTVGGQIVEVEGFFTANEAMVLEGMVYDLPCSVTASAGGSGTLTVLPSPDGFTYDPDGDGILGPSASGVPALFGPLGLIPGTLSTCRAAATPGIGQPPLSLDSGEIGYVGTFRFALSECAVGDFVLYFECTDQPGSLCENPPESTNTTRAREDEPPGAPQGALLSLALPTLTITALPRRYGDIFPTGGNGVIDVDDIYAGLAGFIDPASFPQADVEPCGGDGDIDVDDLLRVLGAFVGEYDCPHPCP